MYSKNDMVYQDYIWDSPIANGQLEKISNQDARKLNRKDGNQMLSYIRSVAYTWEWKGDAIRACQKLEKSIRLKVPSEVQTYGSIKLWVQENFQDFWKEL